MKKILLLEALPLALLGGAIALSVQVVQGAPFEMPIHWRLSGVATEYGHYYSIVVVPVMMLLIYGILTYLQCQPSVLGFMKEWKNRQRAYLWLSQGLFWLKTAGMAFLLYLTYTMSVASDLSIYALPALILLVAFIIALVAWRVWKA